MYVVDYESSRVHTACIFHNSYCRGETNNANIVSKHAMRLVLTEFVPKYSAGLQNLAGNSEASHPESPRTQDLRTRDTNFVLVFDFKIVLFGSTSNNTVYNIK